MDALFTDFATAQNHSQGYLLASTISPTPPPHDPSRLHAFLSSTNAYSLETDLRYKLQYNPDISPKLQPEEVSAWSEVFKAFYKFVSVLLPAEEGEGTGDWAGV
ncbi:COP9 signalosome (CSN) subunit, partial [Oleoguttula sp. CCFEE 5521]